MSKHVLATAAHSFKTPMTREEVGDPLDLSPKGSEAHFKRYGGPGTRSKNPKRFDAAKQYYDDLKAKRKEEALKPKPKVTSKKHQPKTQAKGTKAA